MSFFAGDETRKGNQMDVLNNALQSVTGKEHRKFYGELFGTMDRATADRCKLLAYKKGMCIIKTGDPCASVWFLMSGVAGVTYELASGIFYSFAKFEVPSLLGEMEAFSGHPVYRATVVCETDCVFVTLPTESFLRWMKESNTALFTLMTYLTKKIAAQTVRDRSFLFSGGEKRLIFQLIQYYENNQKNGVCVLRVQRYRLADEICASIKTVNRCILKLKEKGMITQKGRTISIAKEQYELLGAGLKRDE